MHENEINLLDVNTIWAFISGSDEDRFLNDISFGIACLKHRGINYKDIFIFVDQPSGQGWVAAHGFPGGIEIFETNKLEPVLKAKAKDKDKVVIVSTGHGNQNGIKASADIRPYDLIKFIRQVDTIKYGLIVLGQCNAGTFNYLEVKPKNLNGEEKVYPEICVIGATNLHVSISSFVDISGTPSLESFDCNKAWLANLFLLYFMYHVAFSKDTDGDGKVTVVDTYKSAGIGANEELITAKQFQFIAIHDLLSRHSGSSNEEPLLQRMTEEAQKDFVQKSAILLSSQDPWILHANFARQLIL